MKKYRFLLNVVVIFVITAMLLSCSNKYDSVKNKKKYTEEQQDVPFVVDGTLDKTDPIENELLNL